MFSQTWNKYLPVLKILLKRSLNEEQTLMMDASDFQRAAGGRKIKFSYSVTLYKGRLQTMDKPSAVAKEFVTILQEDDTIRQFIRQYDIEFSLNNAFQLSIRTITPSAAEAAPEETAKEE
jgi:hypothetical protein